jgi:hypothetical protein
MMVLSGISACDDEDVLSSTPRTKIGASALRSFRDGLEDLPGSPNSPPGSPGRGGKDDGQMTPRRRNLSGDNLKLLGGAVLAPPPPPLVATVPAGNQQQSIPAVVEKPFFIMDWLEELDPLDLDLARRRLLQHGRQHHSSPLFATAHYVKPDKDDWAANIRRVLFPLFPRKAPMEPEEPTSPEPERPVSSRQQHSSPTSTMTCFGALGQPSLIRKSTPPSSPNATFRERSINIGNIWNARGLHKAEKDQWASALKCWRNALEIRIQVLGESHVDVANTWNNYGIALGKVAASEMDAVSHGRLEAATVESRYEDAVFALENALRLRTLHFGRNHTEVAGKCDLAGICNAA